MRRHQGGLRSNGRAEGRGHGDNGSGTSESGGTKGGKHCQVKTEPELRGDNSCREGHGMQGTTAPHKGMTQSHGDQGRQGTDLIVHESKCLLRLGNQGLYMTLT